jgi:hypothetical protein
MLAPACTISGRIKCLPHRADDASEAAEEHRRRQVDGLVWQVLAAFRGLARAQKCEHSIRETNGHQVLNREPAVMQYEGAVQRVLHLLAMTREMEDVCGLTLESLPKHL